MGQRHQIYVKLPAHKKEPSRIIGIHHQWLYGQTALASLDRLMTYHEKAEYSEFKTAWGDPMECLKAIYSCDPARGYYHAVCPLGEDETVNPMMQDNNNGCTLLDLSGEVPAYCFFSLHHLECLDDTKEDAFKNLVPMSALQYLSLHYPDFGRKAIDEGDDKYRQNRTDFYQRNLALLQAFQARKVITKAQLKKVFPALFAKEPAL